MARGVNKVIVIGNLGQDPETRYMPSGSAVTNLRIATNESWKDKQTGEQQERTEWHRVKFFGRLAEIAGEYLRKGRQVYVEGSLRTDKYTDKDGNTRYTTDIIANEMQMLGGTGGEGGSRGGGEGGGQRGGGDYGNRGGGQRALVAGVLLERLLGDPARVVVQPRTDLHVLPELLQPRRPGDVGRGQPGDGAEHGRGVTEPHPQPRAQARHRAPGCCSCKNAPSRRSLERSTLWSSRAPT